MLDKVLTRSVGLLSRGPAGYFLLRVFHSVCSAVAPYVPPVREIESSRMQAFVPAEVRSSGLPGAGQGLFVVDAQDSGTIIGEYCGDVVDSVLRVFRLADHSYLADTGETGTFIDARRQLAVAMRYINHHFDPSKLNCDMVRQGGQVLVVAIRPLVAGEELFLSYGERYWQLQPDRATRLLARRLTREFRQPV